MYEYVSRVSKFFVKRMQTSQDLLYIGVVIIDKIMEQFVQDMHRLYETNIDS